jgi:3-hydroxyacyl-CoA dehydrogenase
MRPVFRVRAAKPLSGSRPTVRCAVRTTLLLVAALVLGTRAPSTAQAVWYVPANRGKDVNPDTHLVITVATPEQVDRAARALLVADELHAMGRHGQEAGQGWHRYENGRTPIPDPAVVDLIRSTAAAAGIPQRTFTGADIVERSIHGLINDGARVLDEGFARRAADIDVICANRDGFPAWRGGPMFYADGVGLRPVLDSSVEFHREMGPWWTPAPRLVRPAQAGGTRRELDLARRA